MRQMSVGMNLYLSEYDDTFHKNLKAVDAPAAYGFGELKVMPNGRGGLKSWTNWPYFYGPYVKNVDIFNCPLSPDTTEQLTKFNWGNDGNYTYNYDGLSKATNVPAQQATALEEPAAVYAFFTGGDPDVVPGRNDFPACWSRSTSTSRATAPDGPTDTRRRTRSGTARR